MDRNGFTSVNPEIISRLETSHNRARAKKKRKTEAKWKEHSCSGTNGTGNPKPPSSFIRKSAKTEIMEFREL